MIPFLLDLTLVWRFGPVCKFAPDEAVNLVLDSPFLLIFLTVMFA